MNSIFFKHLLLSIFMIISSGAAFWNISSTPAEKAAEYEIAGMFDKAAIAYEVLFEETQTVEYLFKSAQCFNKAGAFKKASTNYRKLILKGNSDARVLYYYGLNLKQEGLYTDAIDVLESARSGGYTAHDIQTDIEGAKLGLKFNIKGKDIQGITRLSDDVNSKFPEFSPMPLSNDLLYFISTRQGQGQIYRANYINEQWKNVVVPENIPDAGGSHFGNGSFSHDFSEFYFSLCKEAPINGGRNSNCEIYLSRKSGKSWEKATRLRDYINWDGSNNIHPFITHIGNKEVLYFASNRTGGQGGYDIWYCTRDHNSPELDFTFPQNAGPILNSNKDEMTPFFDEDNGTLFFSSNGHVNIGGLDIFKATGNEQQWSTPENLGVPANSSADDYYYVEVPHSREAFLTSNRVASGSTNPIGDENIFKVGPKTGGKFYVSGRIIDQYTKSKVYDPEVSLYETIGESRRKFRKREIFQDGRFKYELQAGKGYIVEVYKSGYEIESFEFDTETLESGSVIDITIRRRSTAYTPTFAENAGSTTQSKTYSSSSEVKKEKVFAETTPLKTSTPPNTNVTTSLSSEKPPVKVATSTDKPPVSTPTTTYSKPVSEERTTVNTNTINVISAPVSDTHYRIQLTAVSNYNPNLPIFMQAQTHGNLSSEFVSSINMTRVFLNSFDTKAQAQALVNTMKSLGFDTAFVVKYSGGQRVQAYM